ncbi:MAG: hypothetical protein QW091_00065 [Candidatus Micrarchaeaceae archaeon]
MGSGAAYNTKKGEASEKQLSYTRQVINDPNALRMLKLISRQDEQNPFYLDAELPNGKTVRELMAQLISWGFVVKGHGLYSLTPYGRKLASRYPEELEQIGVIGDYLPILETLSVGPASLRRLKRGTGIEINRLDCMLGALLALNLVVKSGENAVLTEKGEAILKYSKLKYAKEDYLEHFRTIYMMQKYGDKFYEHLNVCDANNSKKSHEIRELLDKLLSAHLIDIDASGKYVITKDARFFVALRRDE